MYDTSRAIRAGESNEKHEKRDRPFQTLDLRQQCGRDYILQHQRQPAAAFAKDVVVQRQDGETSCGG